MRASRDRLLWLLSGGWWGMALGLVLGGGWTTLLVPFALLFGVLMAASAPKVSSHSPAGLAIRALAAGAVVVIAALNGAPPGWVAAGALFPLAIAAVGVAELRGSRPPRTA